MLTTLLGAGLGAIVGLILALTGAGGGILAIPLLVWVLHLPLQTAGPIGLAAVGLASALGAVVGLRQGVVRYRAALLIGATGMLFAPLGVALAQRLPSRPLLLVFAGVMAWVGWRTLRSLPGNTSGSTSGNTRDNGATPVCRVNVDSGRLDWTAPCARALAGTGALSGLLSGLIGVGGGFVIVPALNHRTDLDLRQVQATSLAVIALVSLSGVASAALHGSLDIGVALPFAGGAMAALLVGQRLALQLPAARLRQGFAWLTLAVAASLLYKALA
ncbi:MAG: sulfite exporter TauE/SafE family protein [Proteobacteria bacterium]|uniref:sulfite exporter TauE/SafE family protein n=1 Tax=Aquabacterium sp. TaxID=1872578 RepID=UPI0035C777EA|nr:sulfite exporter TauE/SafE family protein [Pseudomonadota bacterium]